MRKVRKGLWTPEEDQRLLNYIRSHGPGSWRNLPKAAGLYRHGNSCRLRWTNYLRPDIKHGHFTDDEERLVINLHSRLGNKWSSIAKKLPGRTDNDIKNYWKKHLRKKLLDMSIDPVTHPTTKLCFPAAAANFARGGDSGASASRDMKDQKLQSDAAMLQLLQGNCWVSASLGAMGALVGKLDMLLLAPPQGCSSKRVKDAICLLKDDVEEMNSYLDELSKVEDPPPMAKCWMNEARDQSC